MAKTVYQNYSAILKTAFVVGLLSSSASYGQTIYKKVDANGNITYTDIAPTNTDKDTTVKVDAIQNTYSTAAPKSTAKSGSTSIIAEEDKYELEFSEPAISYNSVTISSPAHDATIRANNGNIKLNAAVSPKLAPGHKVRFLLDGSIAGTAKNGTSLQLEAVDRGTHQVAVEVLDARDNVMAVSDATTFHLLRVSRLLPPNRSARAN